MTKTNLNDLLEVLEQIRAEKYPDVPKELVEKIALSQYCLLYTSKLFSDFVHNTILFQVRPDVKSIFCDFDGVCLVRFHLAKGVRAEVLDQFGIHRSDEETGLCELTEQRLIVTACMFHNDARLAVNGLNLSLIHICLKCTRNIANKNKLIN